MCYLFRLIHAAKSLFKWVGGSLAYDLAQVCTRDVMSDVLSYWVMLYVSHLLKG